MTNKAVAQRYIDESGTWTGSMSRTKSLPKTTRA